MKVLQLTVGEGKWRICLEVATRSGTELGFAPNYGRRANLISWRGWQLIFWAFDRVR